MRRALVLVAPLLLAACTASPQAAPAPPAPNPFRPCAGLTATASGAPASAAEPLPGLTLDCYAGGPPVRLADLRGPALVNIWNTACAPCREEMPALQRLADRTEGKLRVVGVVTGDTRAAAGSFAADAGVDYPNVDDPKQQLMAALGKIALPVTVFLDATGSVVDVYNGRALTDAALADLVDRRLGVAVPA